MRRRQMAAAILCGAILLGGCAKTEAVTAGGDTGQMETMEESVGQKDVGVIPQTYQENTNADADGNDAAGNQEDKGAGSDAVVIESGPDKKLYDDGHLIYTLHDFCLYDSPQDALVSADEIVDTDAAYYADRSKFLVMQADINNMDEAEDGKEGERELNLSLFVISPNEPKEELQWEGSMPVYLSEHGTGPTDYYHVFVKPGETKTVTVGFYVPVKDKEELSSQCQITFYGSYDEGYVYKIPKVQ